MTKEELFKIKGGDTFSSPVADGINKNFEKLVEAVNTGGNTQAAAVSDATGSEDAHTQLNALLASLRAAGILATE